MEFIFQLQGLQKSVGFPHEKNCRLNFCKSLPQKILLINLLANLQGHFLTQLHTKFRLIRFNILESCGNNILQDLVNCGGFERIRRLQLISILVAWYLSEIMHERYVSPRKLCELFTAQVPTLNPPLPVLNAMLALRGPRRDTLLLPIPLRVIESFFGFFSADVTDMREVSV